MEFIYPGYLLLLLIIPVMVALAGITSRRNNHRVSRIITGRLRKLLCRPRKKIRRRLSLAAFMAAMALLIAALASPGTESRERPESMRIRNIMVALDVSRSMFATDTLPSRLHAARASVLDLLERFPEDRFGIIAFSGTAWVQVPFTTDHEAVRNTLQQLDYAPGQEADWIPRNGSDLAAAVRLALRSFRKTGKRDNTLVIYSDGETHHEGVEQAASDAKRENLTIFSSGFGSSQGAFIPDPTSSDGRFRDREGALVITKLEPESLSLLASSTGGIYSEEGGALFLSQLESRIERMESFAIKGFSRRIAVTHFQWFLAPSILLFATGMILNSSFTFRRKKHRNWPTDITPVSPPSSQRLRSTPFSPIILIPIFLCITPPTPAEARLLPHTAAGRSLAKGDDEGALRLYESEILRSRGERQSRLKLGAATAAYRLGRFAPACQLYSGALLSKDRQVQKQAHFGMGNSCFYRGLEISRTTSTSKDILLFWMDAVSHFEQVLVLDPENREAAENLELVRKKIREFDKKEKPLNAPAPPDKSDPPATEESKPIPQQQSKPDTEDTNREKFTPPSDQDKIEKPSGNPSADENSNKPSGTTPPGNSQPLPGESPEEFALRILRENADFEMNLLPRRLREQRPKKDW